jgi:L-aspartate oxidase
MKTERVDFLIIGSGVAGLRAAIELAPMGEVAVVTKDRPAESTTEYAQGGIAVALSDEDEVGIHFEDTLRAGDGLCREAAVRILVGEGPERIKELISWGAEFDREGTKLDFTIEAAHSRKRILHAHGDSTGKELERVLLRKVKTLPSVKKYPFAFTKDLLVCDGRCAGALIYSDGNPVLLFASATVLATGGAGQLFARTTNPTVATGDGMAIALRAGAVLEDMEFIQFHPTVLFAPSAPQFLLTEAMRGEGGLLRNVKDERFMKKYHPDEELAPRDVVSRAIVSEMAKTGSSHVFLDLTRLDGGYIKRRFPRIYSTCIQFGVDITREPVPVSPAAHYVMGGVKTDVEGATTLEGLFAAGEVACTGVHGANRLASNSLLEGLVFGARAGRAAAGYASKSGIKKRASFPETLPDEPPVARGIKPDPATEEIRHLLRRLMWEKAGIVRSGVALMQVSGILQEWSDALDGHYSPGRRALELRNMLQVSQVVTGSALHRRGSVGAHYRTDSPEKGSEWDRHIRVSLRNEGPAYETGQ